MINQNITFHLPKYNSNMFCVLKVITDKLTAGGREGRVGHSGQKEILPEGGIDQMY